MDGHDFIKLAGKLAAKPNADEATYRTSVSRAYYGAFHLAKALLEDLGFTPPTNVNVHGFVRHYLHGSGNADACRAASHLGDLQAARNKADYQLSNPDVGSHAYAVIVVEKAHDIKSALATCSQDKVRATVKEAIAEYANKIAPES
jgi:uncharacterized protein (UPF0332 family)